MDYVDKVVRAHGAMVGRMLIGLLFVFSAISIFMMGVEGFAGMIEARGIPMATLVAWVVLMLKIGAGGALILGYRTREAAMVLVIFTGLATLLFHLNLEDGHLFKNLAILGGLLYVYVYGPGSGWKIS